MSDFTDREANLDAGVETVTAILKVGISGLSLIAGGTAFATLGAALAGEVAGNLIPNLRRQRIEKFINILGEEIEALSVNAEHIRRRFESPEFIDLLEDACILAAKSVTDERIRELAKAVKNSLDDEQLDYLYSKRLLGLLGELNDAEVLILRSYSINRHLHEEFWKQYPDLYHAMQDEKYRAGSDTRIWRGQFKEIELHLVRLGLIGPRRSRSNTKELTPLGGELLRKMDYEVKQYMTGGQIIDGTEGLEEVERLVRSMSSF